MDQVNLTSDTFFVYAIKHYGMSDFVSEREFKADLARIGFIKKILNRYMRGDSINFRLLLNHFILLHNVYETYVLVKILFYRMDVEYWSQTKSILQALDLLPEELYFINGEIIVLDDIPADEQLFITLKKVLST